jgi:hypothetical protein
VLRYDLRRIHIEESLRDDKLKIFDPHVSYLADPKRLDALLLSIAATALWDR